MQADPILEMQRLAAHYRELSDDELRDLAADFADLTENAQQALRTEIQSRGFRDPLRTTNAPAASNAPLAAPATYETRAPIHEATSSTRGFFSRQPELIPDAPDAEPDGPIEYTWKTPLCDCDTLLQAREFSQALKQAGIESWIEAPGTGSRYASFSLASHASLSPPISWSRRAPLPRNPFRVRSSKMLRRKFPITNRPRAPNAAHRTPFLKASIPRTPGDVSNAAKAGLTQPHQTQPRRNRPRNRQTASNCLKNGKSRPATGQLSPQGE
jgi:hypothetical protein